jgi:2-polyprenyl-3-methyl-5-hydroxy-6-metoxy-1,4-benzoquinol methylase
MSHSKNRSTLVEPLRSTRDLIRQIAKLTAQPESTVAARLRREHHDRYECQRGFERAWCQAVYVERRIGRFLSTDRRFFYELVAWNRTVSKCLMRGWIGEFFQRASPEPLQVLTYGDGMGFDSLFFAQCGHCVSYFEVSEKCAAFACEMFRTMNTDVEWIDSDEKLKTRRFDAIVCLDVLEHVPAPEELVASLASLLHPGGYLLVSAPFWHVHPSTPTHLSAHRGYSGRWRDLYGSAGLRPVDARWLWDPIVFVKTAAGARSRSAGIMPGVRIRVGAGLLTLARLFPRPFTWMSHRVVCSSARTWLETFDQMSADKER